MLYRRKPLARFEVDHSKPGLVLLIVKWKWFIFKSEEVYDVPVEWKAFWFSIIWFIPSVEMANDFYKRFNDTERELMRIR